MKTIMLLFSILLLSMKGIEASSLDDRASDDSSDHLSPSKARYVGMGGEDMTAFTFGPSFSKYFMWCIEQKKSCNIPDMKRRLKKNIEPDSKPKDWKYDFRSECISFYHNPPEDMIKEMFDELLAEVQKESLQEIKREPQSHRNSYSSTSSEESETPEGSRTSTPEKQPSPKGDKQA